MRICVFGAGAVGGHLAARLGACGQEVSVVARGAHLAAMREKGLVLLHGKEVIRAKLRASEQPEELGVQDIVITTLKANLLPAFAQRAAPLLAPHTAVVFAQNGIPWWYGQGISTSRRTPPDLSPLDPGALLQTTIARERILGAVIYSANEVAEPGVIRNHVPGNNMLVVGEIDDRQSDRVRQLRALLERSGMSSPPSTDIRQAIWAKLVQNLGTSALCVVTGSDIGAVRGDAGLAELQQRVGQEGRAIAQAHGVSLEGAPQRPAGGQSSGVIGHKPSMLQDYERGRPMEIESQLMMPLAFGRSAGVHTPTLDALIRVAAHKAAAKGLHNT
jgi:2-dehydropantoate 2-reductase